ncbi:3'-5' exoribonuclease YhaM family protein [Alteribacter natronophilus]|uniref:3'-5' exoribonuclease YhaM family protein n=1 Tax=Alteribacter natronophilus TaxID=2583810 RepID=UPI00110EE5EB|nr:HD domain-containing protein [Alteribacter natronophilus]TMW71725.1 HD domain-containing protein [Alteribacter natronophilus]
MKTIANVKEGERLVGFFLVKEREVRVAVNGDEYMDLLLGDATGTIPSKIWDITEQQKSAVHVKTILKIDGQVRLFRGKKQLQINRVRIATDEDNIELQSLVRKSSTPREELWQDLRMIIDDVQNDTYGSIIRKLFGNKDVRDRLTTIPASKVMHHAYYAGLLEHIVSLCHATLQLLAVYPHLNKDLLLTTCLLHDIGKIRSINDPITPEYTEEGELVGHLVMSVEMINEAALEAGISLQDEELTALKHCILSQYGDTDKGLGSAISGKIPEAVFFSSIEELDARLNAIQMINGETESGWEYHPMFKRKMKTTE